MKLISNIFLIFALFSIGNSNAQTKDETIQWLKDKLGKCLVGQITEVSDNGTTNQIPKEIKIENFTECEFVVTYYVPHSWDGTILEYRITYPTNIGSIVEKEFMGYKGFVFQYPADVIKAERLTTGDVTFKDYHFQLNIAVREENIIQRIEKALKHLTTFCPKKKETF